MVSGPEFFQTGMGRRFYECTMPDLVRAIEANTKAIQEAAPVVRNQKTGISLRIIACENGFILMADDEQVGFFGFDSDNQPVVTVK